MPDTCVASISHGLWQATHLINIDVITDNACVLVLLLVSSVC